MLQATASRGRTSSCYLNVAPVSESSIPRYCPERPLPPYSYVPGLAPHPTSDERGHSYGLHEPQPAPLHDSSYYDNATYRYAIDLFNHGFYWEAHEAWESLWHAAGRSGPTADFLKGLIKLAAAGVKLREGRAAGVRQHAERAATLLNSVAAGRPTASVLFGLDLPKFVGAASDIAERAEEIARDKPLNAKDRLPFVLQLH